MLSDITTSRLNVFVSIFLPNIEVCHSLPTANLQLWFRIVITLRLQIVKNEVKSKTIPD